MQIYEFDGLRPVVAASAFVHPTAVLIGDVIIGPQCYIGPGASLRGDFGRIVVKHGANVQDNCVMHSFPEQDAVVEENGHIGHGAILHGCLVGRNALVGMNAVVMDGVVVGENAFIAAMAFVKTGFRIPADTLVAGAPARIVRSLSKQEIAWKTNGTGIYRQLAARCLEGLRACEPLPEAEPDRRRTGWLADAAQTLQDAREPT